MRQWDRAHLEKDRGIEAVRNMAERSSNKAGGCVGVECGECDRSLGTNMIDEDAARFGLQVRTATRTKIKPTVNEYSFLFICIQQQ